LVSRYNKSTRRWVIHYYLARDLAARLEVNLAKWKRWSREFLPPDPLGGLQSGFARQYSLKEAFQVALGGFLVGDLKFAVHEARLILQDLGPWLKKAGYLRLRNNGASLDKTQAEIPHDMVFIRLKSTHGGGYLYWLRSLNSAADGEGRGLGNDLDETVFFNFPGVRVINLGGFHKYFSNAINS